MTREEYINLLNRWDIGMIPYKFYLANWSKEKHGQVLTLTEFMHVFHTFYPDGAVVMENLISYYNITFGVVKIQDLKTGKIIKYY